MNTLLYIDKKRGIKSKLDSIPLTYQNKLLLWYYHCVQGFQERQVNGIV